jgi:hypothetical protein
MKSELATQSRCTTFGESSDKYGGKTIRAIFSFEFFRFAFPRVASGGVIGELNALCFVERRKDPPNSTGDVRVRQCEVWDIS